MYSVPTTELPGSPQETWDENGGLQATVTRICAWASRTTLAAEIYGELYPRIPQTLARARSITIVPFPDSPNIGAVVGDAQHAAYDLAKLTIQYKTDGPMEQNGDWFTETLEPTVEFVTLPREGFRWSVSHAPLKEGEEPGKQIRGLEYKLTRYKLTSVPAEVKTLVGCVNNAPISCRRLGLTFAAEELLYHPPTVDVKAKMDGTYELTLAMRFSFKPGGWNTFWNAGTRQWEGLEVDDGSGNWQPYEQYPLADFTPLL